MEQYSIIVDTKNSRVTLKDLENEIIASSISKNLEILSTEGDIIQITFSTALSTEEKTTLTAVVNAHEGNIATEEVIPTEVKVIEEVAKAPFAAKVLANGQKLFKRVHGVQNTILANSTGTIELVVPYTQCKITSLEIMGASLGDTCNFNVYDTSTGYISTIPNYKLNQFGFNVCMAKDYHMEHSEYDADLIMGMKLEIEFNNSTTEDKLIGINFILHQLV